MLSENFIEKLESLSSDDQKEVIDFLLSKNKSRNSKRTRKNKMVNLEEEKFVGMWKNREDLADSSNWVKNLRKSDWAD
ncbi:MAG: hypothetical protein DWQ06_01675 [Calditrichaeota bacterium]|nr:MAG: hypothetical protein DWQ06_01675 [Calditrichota bacterium]